MIKMHYIHEWNFHMIVNSSEDYYLILDFDTRFQKLPRADLVLACISRPLYFEPDFLIYSVCKHCLH